MVELKGISKAYGERLALRSIDLKFPEQKVTALIGPSGCGKSTLLRVVLGLIEPSSGEVLIGGTPMNRGSSQELRQRIGYVVQDGGLFPHLTARENIALVARYLKRPDDQIRKRVEELAELTRIETSLIDRYPVELSGGQKQRISLMRALALKPDLLLLDEPLGALDPLVRAALQSDLKEIFAKERTTVVFVTHDMGEAAYLADTIVLLKDGEIVQEGSFEDFLKRPANPFVTEFLSAQRQVGAIR